MALINCHLCEVEENDDDTKGLPEGWGMTLDDDIWSGTGTGYFLVCPECITPEDQVL